MIETKGLEKLNEREASMVEAALKPHLGAILKAHFHETVAVIVHELDPTVHDAARSLGWDGSSSIFELGFDERLGFAHRAWTGDSPDPITAGWLMRKGGDARALVFVEHGSFLINFHPRRGFYVEPGSLEWPPRPAN